MKEEERSEGIGEWMNEVKELANVKDHLAEVGSATGWFWALVGLVAFLFSVKLEQSNRFAFWRLSNFGGTFLRDLGPADVLLLVDVLGVELSVLPVWSEFLRRRVEELKPTPSHVCLI